MTCQTLRGPDGEAIAIVCTRGPRKRKAACAFCGAPDAGWLCDFELGRKRTCDKPICGGCRVNVGPERDVCPEHQLGRSQLDLFGYTAPEQTVPITKGQAEAAPIKDEPSEAVASAEPVRLRPNAREPVERPDRICPACEGDRVVLLGVAHTAGVGAELITTFACDACRHRWEERRRRTDVCEHGKYELVPCDGCGRTWDTIEWPRGAR